MYIPLTFEGALQKCLFASGGYEGYFISGSQEYKYHFFTGSATLQVQKGTIDNVQIYVIGGGGGGARGTTNTITAGGGGAGGVNYTMNGRLFQGTYNIVVGRGGGSQLTQNTDGNSGLQSSLIGANINLVANGGGGGTWGSGGGGGTSGNGFAGGSSQTQNGGGGGGSTAVGNNATSDKAGDGGSGNTFYIVEYGFGYGCGGGGYAVDTSDTQGFSCNNVSYGAGGRGNNGAGDGANYFGMGGGGGGSYGAAGGSGSVIIQYPIYDYCSNYFNETGSCGCRQITFDISDPLDYYPDVTGSYIYMPCGGTEFASGTLDAYYPKTFCTVSNSYYSVTSNSGYGGGAGFTTSGPECLSASLVPVACSPEAFVPTCTSSIVTIYTPSGSGGNPSDFSYVAKNETTHSTYTTTEDRVKYICISTGSLFNGNEIYAKVLTGNFASLYNTASCNNVTFTSTAVGTRTYRYYNCNGNRVLSAFGGGGGTITVCVDRNTPFGFYGTTSNTSVTIGGDCLSGSFNTGSCGCP
jgi:hypothetical protein